MNTIIKGIKKLINKEECDICTEYINKSNRKKITCIFDSCSKSYCRECFNKFLLDSGLSPKCMWCSKDISLEFIQENTTQTFYNSYMDYRANMVLERCKLTLPQIQEDVDRIIKDRKIKDKLSNFDFKSINVEIFNFRVTIKELASFLSIKIRSLSTLYTPHSSNNFSANNWCNNTICYICNKYYMDLQPSCNNCNIIICNYCLPIYSVCNNKKCCNCSDDLDLEFIKQHIPCTFYNKFIKERKKSLPKEEQVLRINVFSKILELIKNKIILNHKLIELAIEILKISGEITVANKIKDKVVFVKKCPNNDCRGFLSSSWKCGLCEKFFCKDCHKEKNGKNNEEHVCDESEKATVAMLKKDTKPCPQCGMPIDRYTGCSQVWTPCCKIAFDWNTGKIDNGRIHSPEYYDFLRRTEGFVPRERDDNICGGNVDIYSLRRILKKLEKKLNINVDYIHRNNIYRCFDHHRQMEHINNVLIPTLPTSPDAFEKNDLGISYLLKEIDENKWKFELKKRIKKTEKNHNILNILRMYINVINDLFKNLIEDKNIDLFLDNANKLIIYTNDHTNKIQKKYKSNKSFELIPY